jgi:hypothetical protein
MNQNDGKHENEKSELLQSLGKNQAGKCKVICQMSCCVNSDFPRDCRHNTQHVQIGAGPCRENPDAYTVD